MVFSESQNIEMPAPKNQSFVQRPCRAFLEKSAAQLNVPLSVSEILARQGPVATGFTGKMLGIGVCRNYMIRGRKR